MLQPDLMNVGLLFIRYGSVIFRSDGLVDKLRPGARQGVYLVWKFSWTS